MYTVFQKCLRRLFGDCGKISVIHTQKNPGTIEHKYSDSTKMFPEPVIAGFHVAYITYESESSVLKALKKCESDKPHVLSTKGKEVTTGIKSKFV